MEGWKLHSPTILQRTRAISCYPHHLALCFNMHTTQLDQLPRQARLSLVRNILTELEEEVNSARFATVSEVR